ncbi:MAG TPA: hypothetical protein DEG47_06450 [Cyanobacteria bacterium UBA11148]|nr:hypothetical protein [Cyanobacteria bacterium UBA11148]
MKTIIILTSCILSISSSLLTEQALASIRSTPPTNTTQVIPNPQQPTHNSEQQAQQLYENGQFTAAIPLLEDAIANYSTQGDSLSQARVFRNLALIYQQLGDWNKANDSISESLNRLETLANTEERTKLLAQTLDVQGQIQLLIGQPEDAVETWKRATDIYKQIGDNTGFTRSKINQVQALKAIGLYAQASKTLTEIQDSLNEQPDSLLKVKTLQSLGDVLREIGQLTESYKILQQSLVISEKLQSPEAVATTLLSLGNTTRSQQQPETALDFYQRAAEMSPLISLQVQAQLNQLSLLIDQDQESKAKAIIPIIESLLTELPPSQTAVYAQINLARSKIKLENRRATEFATRPTSDAQASIANDLVTAVKQAQNLGDKRAETYAIGSLGGLYEQNQRWDEARSLTEKALLIAQGINASDITYQWQWQLGRIVKKQGDRQGAIAAYTQSIKTLKSLRSDLVAISSDAQFSFRESVEPVYRELVDLLLQPGANQEELKQARDAIEALQLAELDNFFRDACLDAKPVQIDQLDPTAAIFYTIILNNRLEVIVTLPGKPLRHYTTLLPQLEIDNTLKKMRESLAVERERPFNKNRLQLSQTVYDWLIRPIEAELTASGIKNLVFVSDGFLRNISIAALYDGKQYLVEKYAVAVAPSLQLIDPKPLPREQLQVLGAGLTQARQGFGALPNVKLEFEGIEVAASSEVLLNQSFTESTFKKAVNTSSFQVVHLATHGEFSSKAEDTFLLTWDDRLNVDELNSLLRADKQQIRPIELLVLSACRTAAGDNRAALGLAGVAVRAGARSTVASLWYVSDEATSLLMTHFYQELARSQTESGDPMTKAEALRRAQLAVLRNQRFTHPYYWSAFVLVGNWL